MIEDRTVDIALSRNAGGARGELYALDYCVELIEGGAVDVGMDELFDYLFHARCGRDPDDWRSLVERIRQHPITRTVHTCEIAQRAFKRPRGYPGDAVLIDHLYGCGAAKSAPHPGTVTGQIYGYLSRAAASRAVRYRRRRLADSIDALAARELGRRASLVAVAAGHLRELELARCVHAGDYTPAIHAVDQDEASLRTIAGDYSHLGIDLVAANVKDIVLGRMNLPRSDLIYAAGLLDYLATSFATALMRTMFQSLNPGGTLLVANFLPNVRSVGFMEAMMDWWLTYRDEDGMRALLGEIPLASMASQSIYRDPDHQIVFLEVIKR